MIIEEQPLSSTSLPRIDIQAQAVYVPEQSNPDTERYVFAYTVTIRNIGEEPAQLVNRHWIISDANGETQEVRGEGVVGEQPYLRPGEGFQYTSAAMIPTPIGNMRGSYEMRTDTGESFEALIPAFSLALPNILH